jgi:hypothetical protein
MPSRGGGGQGPAVQSPQGSPSSLLSQDSEGSPSESEKSPDDMVSGMIQSVRGIHTKIDALARQFPEFAPAAREAGDALMKGLSAVAAKQRTPQQGGAAPPVG